MKQPFSNGNSKTVADEPNSLETLHWPSNVLLFHPPSEDDDEATKVEKIADIKRRIQHTQDPTQRNPFDEANNNATTFTSDNHFSPNHYALLFAPGEYRDCDFEVGYYVQMIGLGASATDVKFTSSTSNQPRSSGPCVPALNKHLSARDYATIPYDGAGLCLDTFWRAAENFSAVSTTWAVSQAAPLRRVEIEKDLSFGDGGAYASGGVLANARVHGKIHYVTQQQFYTRNVHLGGGHDGGAWNLTFTGCTQTSEGRRDSVPFDVNGHDPNNHGLVYSSDVFPAVRMEKPFVTLQANRWFLRVPQPTRQSVSGPHLDERTAGEARDFARVKVVIPRPVDDKDIFDADSYNSLDHIDESITQSIQYALDKGKDIVLCPGTFFLTKPLVVQTPNQVILGLGLATLVSPQNGSPCIRVKANIPGVRIAGITFEASAQKRSTFFGCLPSLTMTNGNCKNSDGVRSLLEFGEPNIHDPGEPNNPGLLSDIFCRVGGMNLNRLDVQTDVMVRIHSGNVIGDNLWLWRADHSMLDSRHQELPNDPNLPLYHQTRFNEGARVYECAVDTAMEVQGEDVSMFGLFCEHTLKDQLVWKGQRGSVSFFQCELPYDLRRNDFENHVGYKLDDSVHHHTARGIGVYCNFQVDAVRATAGACCPKRPKISIMNPFTIFLDGHIGSRIDAVLIETDHYSEESSRIGVPVTISSKGVPSRP